MSRSSAFRMVLVSGLTAAGLVVSACTFASTQEKDKGVSAEGEGGDMAGKTVTGAPAVPGEPTGPTTGGGDGGEPNAVSKEEAAAQCLKIHNGGSFDSCAVQCGADEKIDKSRPGACRTAPNGDITGKCCPKKKAIVCRQTPDGMGDGKTAETACKGRKAGEFGYVLQEPGNCIPLDQECTDR